MRCTGKGKNKGVSEVIGYLLVFSIVVTIVSVVYASGMPVVEQTKESSALQSMETVFLTMQSTIKKVALAQSPVRTMKLNLVTGSMSASESAGDITISTNVSPPILISFGNITYTLGSRRLSYENGAVIEHSPGGNIIVSEPLIFFTNYSGSDNTYILISVINASGTCSTGGGIANMQMRQSDPNNDTKVVYDGSEAVVEYVNISINSPYALAWSLFLNNSYKKTFGQLPTNAGRTEDSCWLKITKGTDGVENLHLTLVTHNVSVSQT
jgi:hypothetical protein